MPAIDLTFIEQIVISYLQQHPEVVQKLIETLLNQVIASLETQAAAAAVPKQP